jgi:hypothetical protein
MNTIRYSYSIGKGLEEHEAKDIAELQKQVRQLSVPKRSLYLDIPAVKDGWLDFHVLNDGSIEMEILDGIDDDFAIVDIPMAAQIVEIALTDLRILPLRRKLDGLPIHWLT